MLQIKELTDDQIARTPEWVEKWIAVGLSTERTQWEEVERAVLACYEVCHLPRPRVLLRVGSPYAATRGGAIAVALLSQSQICSQVWSQVGSQIWDQLRSQMGSQVWRHHMRSQMGREVESRVGSQVWSQVGSHVERQIRSEVGIQMMKSCQNGRGGQFWTSWYAYVTYLRDVCGWDDPALKLFALDEALQTAGWIWWHEAVCVISDRPIRLLRDSQHRLHAADGMAIEYADGWGVYAWHGVRVDADVIQRPDLLTSERILDESNVEVRRVMVERVGLDRFLVMAKAKSIDTDQDGRRILYQIDWQDDEPIVAVKVRCPSTGQIYFLRVPPTIRRCDQAVAWTFGYENVTEYKPQVET